MFRSGENELLANALVIYSGYGLPRSGGLAIRIVMILLAATVFSASGSLWGQSTGDFDETATEVSWKRAKEVVGHQALISGTVVDVAHSGRVYFLNFDTARPPKFVGIIFRDKLSNFPQPLTQLYRGKPVRIRGRVTTYLGHPQIVVTHPDQIEILDQLPKHKVLSTYRWKVDNEFVVASYNVLNLFDAEDDVYRADETTEPKTRDAMQQVANVIRQLNADMLALQEVENRGYLERFVEMFLGDMGYEHIVHFEGNDLRGIDVCLISRMPVGRVSSWRHMTFPDPLGNRRRFSRDVLMVTIEPDGAKSFDAWIVHLKSNFGGREHAEPIRLGEAKQIRKMLDRRLQENSHARVLVLGDFNDTWESATLKTIIGSGKMALFCPWSKLTDPEKVSYHRGPRRSTIDFILSSPAMAKQYIPGSYEIVTNASNNAGSDHNPVIARFSIP